MTTLLRKTGEAPMPRRVFICEPFAHYEYCHANADTQNLAIGMAARTETIVVSHQPFFEPLEGLENVQFYVQRPNGKPGPHAPSRPGRIANGLATANFAVRLSKQLQPDLMLWPNGDALSVCLAAGLSGVPGQLLLHNATVAEGAEVGWRFRLFWLWEKACLQQLARKGRLFSAAERVTDELLQHHRIQLPVGSTISIGIRPRELPPVRPPQSRVLVFGGITARKNYPCVIEGFLAQSAYRELVIAGVLQDARVPALLREKDPNGRIRLIDRYVSESELADLFASADIAVQPHGLGYTLASGTLSRAMEFGVPVVGPDSGQVGDWISRYGIGEAFLTDSAASLAGVLTRTGSNYEAFYQSFRLGYARLMQDWSWERVASRFIDRYVASK